MSTKSNNMSLENAMPSHGPNLSYSSVFQSFGLTVLCVYFVVSIFCLSARFIVKSTLKLLIKILSFGTA